MKWDCEAGRGDTAVGDAGSGGTRGKQSSPFECWQVISAV